jgi:hypothetical protein
MKREKREQTISRTEAKKEQSEEGKMRIRTKQKNTPCDKMLWQQQERSFERHSKREHVRQAFSKKMKKILKSNRRN